VISHVATVHDPGVAARRERLWRLADERGIVAGIAIDHRDSLRALLDRRGLGGLTSDDLRVLKLHLAKALAPAATSIMLDEELGGLALDSGAVPPSVGLIMPLEAQGPADRADPVTTLMADFTAADAARRGADACKVLVPFRPDRPAAAARQSAVIRAAAEDCHAAGLPLVVEPVVGHRPGEAAEAFASDYPALVAGAAARIRDLGVDLLKLPFPVLDLGTAGEAAATAACQRLDDACAGTPWVLLGAGADTELFVTQIRIAGVAVASGFLVGRGIWGSALDRDPEAVGRAASGPGRDALIRCRDVASRFARPLPRAA